MCLSQYGRMSNRAMGYEPNPRISDAHGGAAPGQPVCRRHERLLQPLRATNVAGRSVRTRLCRTSARVDLADHRRRRCWLAARRCCTGPRQFQGEPALHVRAGRGNRGAGRRRRRTSGERRLVPLRATAVAGLVALGATMASPARTRTRLVHNSIELGGRGRWSFTGCSSRSIAAAPNGSSSAGSR